MVFRGVEGQMDARSMFQEGTSLTSLLSWACRKFHSLKYLLKILFQYNNAIKFVFKTKIDKNFII